MATYWIAELANKFETQLDAEVKIFSPIHEIIKEWAKTKVVTVVDADSIRDLAPREVGRLTDEECAMILARIRPLMDEAASEIIGQISFEIASKRGS